MNTYAEDYIGTITADGRTIYVIRFHSKQNIGGDKEDAWVTTQQSDGIWSVATNVGPPINNDLNNAIVGVTPDGNTVLIMHVWNSESAEPG